MAQFKISRGNSSRLDNVEFEDGRTYLTTDDGSLYFDAVVDGANKRICVGSGSKATIITLKTTDWDQSTKAQTVAVDGVLADDLAQIIYITPHPDSSALCGDVYCSAQGADELTFSAGSVLPAEDLRFVVEVAKATIMTSTAGTITFSLVDTLGTGSYTLTAEDGMTWEQFINSVYNPMSPAEGDIDGKLFTISSGYVMALSDYQGNDVWEACTICCYDDEDYHIVQASEPIFADKTYTIE